MPDASSRNNPPVGDHDDLVENPAWVTTMLARHWDMFSSKVPPKWMPQLTNLRSMRGRVSGRLRELGCGAYGCVLPTLDDNIVLKVTTDDTEAEFAAKLSTTLLAPICVAYKMVISLNEKYRRRPVFVLWREEAFDVGELENDERALPLINAQHQAAQEAFEALHDGETDQDEIAELMERWVKTCRDMGTHPQLHSLSLGLIRVWKDQGIFFGDLHPGNLGRPRRDSDQWVITDPGHVALIAR